MAKRDEFTRNWITQNAIDIVSRYEKGVLTIRGLHYQLVSIGMTNTMRHYKRVVSAMIEARWEGLIDFDVFSDNDREMIGETDYNKTDVPSRVDTAKWAIGYYMKNYQKNRWENQPYYPEVFIEKKALQGVFEKPCKHLDVALGACKGYPSLTFVNEAAERFKEAKAEGKTPIILYFGDYDPSGEDIPRSIEANLIKLGVEVEVRRFALMEEQVVEWGLPPAPVKAGDSRSAKWAGLGQVELDAVEPSKLQRLCEQAINSIFDEDLYEELMEQEEEERTEFREIVKKYVNDELSGETEE